MKTTAREAAVKTSPQLMRTNSPAKSTPSSVPTQNEPSRLKSGTPRQADHAHTRAPDPAPRSPAWKIGEKPELATLIDTWLSPQQRQRTTIRRAARRSSWLWRFGIGLGEAAVLGETRGSSPPG